MAIDSAEQQLPPQKRNPLHYRDHEGLDRAAILIGDIYKKRGDIPLNPGVREIQKKYWNRVLDSGFISERSKVGVERMQKLLNNSVKVPLPEAEHEAVNTPALDFADENVKNLLLDLFAADPRITTRRQDERLQQIFYCITHDQFRNVSHKLGLDNPPELDRVLRTELYFTHESLEKAIGFFLIEPDLLPEVPQEQTDEK